MVVVVSLEMVCVCEREDRHVLSANWPHRQTTF